MSLKKRVLICDRDGVINIDSKAFIKTLDEWVPLPGSIRALAQASREGFEVYVASNQSGVGRGLLSMDDLNAMTARLADLVRLEGGHISGSVFCIHHPEAGCTCRKPLPGLLYQLRDQFGIHLAESLCVGDSLRDLEAAEAAGVDSVLVLTGNGHATQALLGTRTVPVFSDLSAVVDALCQGKLG